MKSTLLCAITFAGVTCAAGATPCDGVDRTLTKEQAKALAPHVAHQFKAESADVLGAFRFRGWTILYIDTHDADEAFVFYRSDPARTRYITTWSGGAGRDEEDEIRRWISKTARGIPNRLARCFAWDVTKKPSR